MLPHNFGENKMEDLTITIPESIENLQLPNPELLTFFSDLTKRRFWVNGEINDYSLELIKKIIAWNEEDNKEQLSIENRKPIKLFFFSPGGDLDVNNALIDIIKLSKTPIWGINIGQCASAAAFIYLSCHRRFMLEQGYFLFHQGSGSFSGTFQEVCAQIEDYQKQVQNLMDFMEKYTKYSKQEIEEKIIGEWYVRKEEALEKGVCDELISDISTIL